MNTAPDYVSLGGTLPVGSPSYLARQADDELRETLLAYRYALVLDSRQKGKSSLIAHVGAVLRKAGFKVLKLDLQRFGSTLNSDQWYSALLLAAGEQLDAFAEAQEVRKAKSHESLAQRWINLLERHAVASEVGLVVFIDEVDFLRSLPFDTDDFLAVIRSSFQRRSENGELRKLVFCFCGASTPAGLVRNPALGEMIIGTRITLQDFSESEIRPYLDHLVQNNEATEHVLSRIHSWTGGHPYLTQLACAEWNRHGRNLASVDEFFRKQTATVGNQHQSDHLVALSRALLNVQLPDLPVEESRVRVLDALSQIARAARISASRFPRVLIDSLLICGVIREEGSSVMIRNRIYQEAFSPQWIRDHLPNAEVRRQQAAARRAFAVTGGLAIAIIGVLGFLAFQNYHLAGRLGQALTQAQKNEREARLEAYVGAMQSVSAEMQDGNLMRAGLVLDSLAGSPLRGWEWHYADRVASTEVKSLSFDNPIRTWISNNEGQIIAVSNDESTSFVDEAGRVVSRISHGVTLTNPRLVGRTVTVEVPSGTLTIYESGATSIEPLALISQSEWREVRWDDEKRSLVVSGPGDRKPLTIPFDERAGAAAHSDRLDILVVRGKDKLSVFDLNTGRLEHTLQGFLTINEFVIDEQHARLFVATDRPEVQAFDLRTGAELPMLLGNEGPVKSLALSRDNRTLLTGGSDGITRSFDTATGQLRSAHYGHKGSVLRVTFAENDATFWTSSNDNTLKKWRLDGDEPKRVIETGSKEAPRFRIAQNSSRLVALFPDGYALTSVVGNASAPLLLKQEPGVSVVGRSIVNQDEAVFLQSDGVVLWQRNGKLERLSLGDQARDAKLLVSDEKTSEVVILLASGKTLALELTTGKLRPISEDQNGVATVAVVSGGKLVIGFRDGKYQLWDMRGPSRILTGDTSVLLQNIEISPSGEQFSISLGDGRVLVCDSQTGVTLQTLRGHSSRVWRASFSRDGRFVITCSFDNSARIWDAQTGRELQRLQMKSWVGDASFNPDATRVVTACGDGSIRLWSVATGREVFILHKQKEPMFTVRFTPDGLWIVGGTIGGKLLMWNGSPQAAREPAQN